jgi:hypothetical protein
MKNFTMIPDALRRSRRGGGLVRLAQLDIVAYLIRAYQMGWDDLTIQQIAFDHGLNRKTAGRHFNHIVDTWIYQKDGTAGFIRFVEFIEDYRGLDFPRFYQWLLATQKRAKSNIPKTPHLSYVGTGTCPTLGHYKTSYKTKTKTVNVLDVN